MNVPFVKTYILFVGITSWHFLPCAFDVADFFKYRRIRYFYLNPLWCFMALFLQLILDRTLNKSLIGLVLEPFSLFRKRRGNSQLKKKNQQKQTDKKQKIWRISSGVWQPRFIIGISDFCLWITFLCYLVNPLQRWPLAKTKILAVVTPRWRRGAVLTLSASTSIPPSSPARASTIWPSFAASEIEVRWWFDEDEVVFSQIWF